jgi:hypothetical protein
VSLEYNRFGKYDYILHTTTLRSAPKSCPAAISWTLYGEYYYLPYGWYHGEVISVRQWRVGYTHTLSFYKTGADAAAATNGGDEGGSPHQVGDFWVAHKIVRTDEVVSGIIAV